LDETKKKTRRKLITVDSILTQDNVKDLLERLTKDQKNITHMICVYKDREDCLSWKVTEGITIDQIVSMLEQAKICILTQTEEE
jgi:hypothetical protein